MQAASWPWFVGLAVAVVLLFVVLFRLSSTIEPDEPKANGEKFWGGGE